MAFLTSLSGAAKPHGTAALELTYKRISFYACAIWADEKE
jgi:hypothetical protein